MQEDNIIKGNTAIAYFSMEIAIAPHIPTYSGGLGVLAGDTVKSAADMELPFIAVSLIHRKGYFKQNMSPDGTQIVEPDEWHVEDYLEEMPQKVSISIENRSVFIRAWKYEVTGVSGFKVPVFLLDTNFNEISEFDRTLTHYLYGGDNYYRFCQEVILGIGGVRMLRALGYKNIEKFHINEGHSSMLTLELLDERVKNLGRTKINHEDIKEVKKSCVFTTHTPVPTGHDQFPLDLVNKVLGKNEAFLYIRDLFCFNEKLNMTHLALNLSSYINGVTTKHQEITSQMFAPHKINAITNGVHALSWACPEFQALFNAHIPNWKEDNFSLKNINQISKKEIWDAHIKAKQNLINFLNLRFQSEFSFDTFTIGHARRATRYKRGDLIFHDLERLKSISQKVGPVQILFSGKAHLNDYNGQEIIKRIHEAKEKLKNYIKVIFVPNYEIEFAKLITSGVDLWLNTPEPPLEASGTSGMKAAINGVPSLSTLDGWWLEGHIEGVTGWSIGDIYEQNIDANQRNINDAKSLYDKLEYVILPMFYKERAKYTEVMINSIAVNGSFFNTQRMLQEYVTNAYQNHSLQGTRSR